MDLRLEPAEVGPPPDSDAEALGVGGQIWLIRCRKCGTFLTDRQSRQNAAHFLTKRPDGRISFHATSVEPEISQEEFVSGLPVDDVVAAARTSYAVLFSPDATPTGDTDQAAGYCELAAWALRKAGDLRLASEFAGASVRLEEQIIASNTNDRSRTAQTQLRNRRAQLANAIAEELGTQPPYQMMREKQAKSGGCFIATAASGSPTSWEVLSLSEFRDTVLMRTRTGRLLAQGYYKLSPCLAAWIARRHLTRKVCLWTMVRPAAWLARVYSSLIGEVVPGNPRASRVHRPDGEGRG
jgi:hypothetical protein